MAFKRLKIAVPKIEYQRLFGELRRAGINTGIVTSKLPHRG